MDKKRRRSVSRRRVANSNLVATGCVIYAIDTKRYLFLLRSDEGKYGNTWGIAGGKVENQESTVTGLQREIVEEIGNIDIKKIVPLETFISDNKKFTFYTYLVTVEQEFLPTLNEEHDGYCWVYLHKYPRPLHPGVSRSFKFDRIVEKLETVQKLADVSFLNEVPNTDVTKIA